MAECQMPTRPQGRERPPRPPPPGGILGQANFRSMQKCHDKAYENIEKGLSLDEQGQIDAAVKSYEDGLKNLSQALDMDAEKVCEKDEDKDTAKQMQQKMTKTKLQITYRLQTLQAQIMSEVNNHTNGHASLESAMDIESPPSYEQAMSRTDSNMSEEAFVSIGDSIMSDSQSGLDSLESNATEILSISDGVQIFYISPEGFVSAPSYPSALRIAKFNENSLSEGSNIQRPPAFLQVHDWYYPLVPGTSPALRATNGAYIFPDMSSQQQGAAVGLILPENISGEERQNFERTLGSLTLLQEQQPSPVSPSAPPLAATGDSKAGWSSEATAGERDQTKGPQEGVVGGKTEQEETRAKTASGQAGETTTSEKISKGITVAADWISWGVGKGAEKTSNLIRLGSEKVRERLKPEEKAAEIDPRLQSGARYARSGANVAIKVSSFIINKLGEATVAVAKEVAPHIRKQGQKILPKSVTEKSSDGKSKIDDVIDVAATGVKGFGTVYISLESAAKVLARNIAQETVHTVDHKYGQSASKLTENTLYTMGNVAMTAYNVDQLGIKALAKRAAKATGKEVVKDFCTARSNKGMPQ
ncbi:spartin-like [Mizuhopecten yessoensis]|uniref:Spartin n=1 Tax=Mizuhopecten yessoensis TaxID=6573 RepID=A0A210QQQ8_MIZYE|nr:spartin-like [Mizuhopecten yessoensis]OWF51065.1 Spartin [Mizuhopecten yessoensis]